MERHIRDVLEDEVIYDHAQFGLLNSQEDDTSITPVLMENKHKPRRRKWGKLLRTAALCGAYVSLGLCFSVTGPTLLFLKEQVGTTMSEISYIFTARSLGTLAGAFIGGSVLDKCNPYSTFFMILASMGISIGAMPWFKHLWALMASSAIIGIGNGFLDTGASTLCLQLWGKDSGPYMQSLHFAFAVGGSIAPLLVEAFVAEAAVPNQTLSSRHVRSITESTFNPSYINNTSVASIIQAATEAPALVTNVTANNVTFVSTLPSTTTIPPVINATAGMLNQTTQATEKPKKPKPVITNGAALGSSSQFEGIPLINEPVQPEPPETTSTTTQTPETTSTTSTSTSLSTTLQAFNATTVAVANSSNPNATEQSSAVNSTSGSSLESTKIPFLSTTLNDSVTTIIESNVENVNQISNGTSLVEGNSTSVIQNSEDVHFVDNPQPTTSTTTPKSLDAIPTSHSKDPKEEGSITSTIKPTEATTTIVTTAIATTNSSPPSTTTTVSTTTSSATTTLAPLTSTSQAPVKTEAQPPSTTTQQITSDPSTTTTTTESIATKSRGRNRGQQEEVSLAIPTRAPAESVSTTISGAEIGKNDHPNVVVDYLERFGVTRMHMLYTVIAIIVLHTSFAFLFFVCSSTAFSASLNAERHATDRKVRPFRPKTRLIFVSLMFLFYLLYVGAEVVFAQFLATFTLESHSSSSTSTANYVTTTFWVAFAVGRFAAIFIANFVNPTIMLYSNLGLTAFGAIILCATAQTNVTLLYIGSALIGFGMAPTFATGFVWTELHLLVTNRISSVFCIGSAMGEMFFPTVTGSLIEGHPMALMYEVFGSILMCIFIIVVAGYLANYKSKRGADSAGYHLACQTEELSQN